MFDRTQSEHSMKKLVIWAGALIVALFAIGAIAGPHLFSRSTPAQTTESGALLGDAIRSGEAPKPAFTAETEQKLRVSAGFDVLVSYTDAGFEPRSVTIAAGDTVRFTNNASRPLALTVGSTQVTLAPQDFHEETFSAMGESGYSDGTDSGTVTVR